MQRVLAALVYVLAAVMISGGLAHFRIPEAYLKMMPPFLPAPLLLVYVSGVLEILGGVGLLIPRTRRAAAWGLVALLIAVFPANLYQAWAEIPIAGLITEPWQMWLRLPLQVPLILWAWAYTRRPAPGGEAGEGA